MTKPIGIRTSGQHDVQFDLVQPYQHFPKKITGPTVWEADDFRSHPERWLKKWTAEHIQELEEAYDSFAQSKLPITAITKVCHSAAR